MRAIYLDPSVRATTHTLTPTTLANPSHNSRVPQVHPSSRATTQEMPFWATTQRMSSVYPISWATTQGIPFWATTQGMLQQSSSLRFHLKPRRPRTSKSPSNYLTMDPRYTYFHEPARSWSCLYESPRS